MHLSEIFVIFDLHVVGKLPAQNAKAKIIIWCHRRYSKLFRNNPNVSLILLAFITTSLTYNPISSCKTVNTCIFSKIESFIIFHLMLWRWVYGLGLLLPNSFLRPRAKMARVLMLFRILKLLDYIAINASAVMTMMRMMCPSWKTSTKTTRRKIYITIICIVLAVASFEKNQLDSL